MTNPEDARRLVEGIQLLVRRFSISERADVSCCGLTVAQAATLGVLRSSGPQRLGELGTRLGIRASTLTRNLERIEEAGLLVRRPDPHDARAVCVSLSAKGRTVAAEVARREQEFAASILDEVPAARRGRVVESLDDLLRAVVRATETCCPGAFDHLMEGFPRGSDPRRRKAMKETITKEEGTVQRVRERYGALAESGGCCSAVSKSLGYSAEDLQELPDGADLSLGCGAPLRELALRPGETVLDLGSGGGIDVFLASRAVGPEGRAIGVDMTPEMLERARGNARSAGLTNVEFREGRLEALPLGDASVDAVTSNCVINLVPDKTAVFREIARVLKPGGRVVIADIVLDGRLPENVEENVYAYVGCVSGASQRPEYFERLTSSGLGQVEILRDVDYLAGLREAAPDEFEKLREITGVTWEQVEGKVRSLTFRARKA